MRGLHAPSGAYRTLMRISKTPAFISKPAGLHRSHPISASLFSSSRAGSRSSLCRRSSVLSYSYLPPDLFDTLIISPRRAVVHTKIYWRIRVESVENSDNIRLTDKANNRIGDDRDVKETIQERIEEAARYDDQFHLHA